MPGMVKSSDGFFSFLTEVSKSVEQATRRAGKAVDRAIRRLEDQHRGDLPYMRHHHMDGTIDDQKVDLSQLLANADAEALRTAAKVLKTSAALDRDHVKAVADELTELTAAFRALADDNHAGPAQSKPGARREPVMATTLDTRLRDLAATVDTPRRVPSPNILLVGK